MQAHRERKNDVPRWAKVQGVLVILLIVIVIAMSAGLVGDHGPTGEGYGHGGGHG